MQPVERAAGHLRDLRVVDTVDDELALLEKLAHVGARALPAGQPGSRIAHEGEQRHHRRPVVTQQEVVARLAGGRRQVGSSR